MLYLYSKLNAKMVCKNRIDIVMNRLYRILVVKYVTIKLQINIYLLFYRKNKKKRMNKINKKKNF